MRTPAPAPLNLSGGFNPEMQILYILIAILILGFIVTAHEFGHYLVGRLCGIGIVEFSIGFGPKLFGFKRKEIQYSLRLIPLGGFCAFVGEDENNSAPNAMNNQPVWKRFLTVAAGPAMNFVLAFLFCAILLSSFIVAEYLPHIDYIYENTPAAECGLQLGDVLVDVNGTDISFDGAGMETARNIIINSEPGAAIELTVKREGGIHVIAIQPEEIIDESSGKTSYQIGIAFGGRTYRFGEALGRSLGYMVEFTREMLKSLKDLVFHGTGADDMMGPVGIISFVSDQVASDTIYAVINLIFVLSLNIGIMNLLPLPALDGGRLVFLIIEAIRRKPIPPEKEGMVHAAGMGLLLMLIVFITYKDIIRLFAGV